MRPKVSAVCDEIPGKRTGRFLGLCWEWVDARRIYYRNRVEVFDLSNIVNTRFLGKENPEIAMIKGHQLNPQLWNPILN